MDPNKLSLLSQSSKIILSLPPLVKGIVWFKELRYSKARREAHIKFWLLFLLSFMPPWISLLKDDRWLVIPFFLLVSLVVLLFASSKDMRREVKQQIYQPILLVFMVLAGYILLHSLYVYGTSFRDIDTPLLVALSKSAIILMVVFLLLAFATPTLRHYMEPIEDLLELGLWLAVLIAYCFIFWNALLYISGLKNLWPYLGISVLSINRALLIINIFLLVLLTARPNKRVFLLLLSGYFLCHLSFGIQFFADGTFMMRHVRNETVEFGIPLAMFVYGAALFLPRFITLLFIGGITLLFMTAPLLFRYWYAIASSLPLPAKQNFLTRAEIWDVVSQRIVEVFWFGEGIKHLSYKQDLYLPSRELLGKASHFLHPHNMILQIWLDIGAVGVFLTILLVLLPLSFLLHVSRHVIPGILATSTLLLVTFLITYNVWSPRWFALALLTILVLREVVLRRIGKAPI